MRFAIVIAAPPDDGRAAAFAETSNALAQALAELGHECVELRNRFPADAVNIILGAQLLPGGVSLPPASVVFNLEQIEPGSPWLTADYLALLRRSRVWDYSAANVGRLGELGVRHAVHVPLGYSPCMTRIARAGEDIDVLFYGSLNERRLAVLKALRERGHHVMPFFGAYGAERDALIARAKIVLNLHYYEARVFEIVRVGYLLANRSFVVSETGSVADEEAEFAGGVAFSSYEKLVDCCEQWLKDPAGRERVAARGFEIMRARPQAACLAPAVRMLAGAVP